MKGSAAQFHFSATVFHSIERNNAFCGRYVRSSCRRASCHCSWYWRVNQTSRPMQKRATERPSERTVIYGLGSHAATPIRVPHAPELDRYVRYIKHSILAAAKWRVCHIIWSALAGPTTRSARSDWIIYNYRRRPRSDRQQDAEQAESFKVGQLAGERAGLSSRRKSGRDILLCSNISNVRKVDHCSHCWGDFLFLCKRFSSSGRENV